jgi:hypothetical protein
MLKKIIIGGLVIIAILGAILIFETMRDRGEPTRPDSLINKDSTISETTGSIFSGFDDNDTNTTIEEAVTVIVPSEEPKEEPRVAPQNGSEATDSIDDNNNIYSNDYSSQQNGNNEPAVEEESKEPQKIDTSLKESLGDIQSKVQRKINNSSSLSGSSIEVSTNDKGIVLSGTVTSAKQKILAGSIANSASENATVVNRITVVVPKPVETEKPKDSEAVPVASPEKSM